MTSPTSRRTSKASKTPRSLHLFGRDLRLTDNAGLTAAARAGEVVAGYVARADATSSARNARRGAYAAGALASLARDLDARGTRLVCRYGPLVPTVVRLVRESAATTVTFAHAYDAATRAAQADVRRALEALGLDVVAVHDAPAVAPDASAAVRSEGGGYRALSPYVAAWSALPREPVAANVVFATHALDGQPVPAPAAAAEANDAEVPDERRALAAFDAYLANAALHYPSARDVPAGPSTARISAALSFGVLSARTLLERIDRRARDPFLLTEERLALAAFARAFAERDFFLQLAWYYEDAPGRALQSRMHAFPAATEHPALDAWRRGATGFPLVDAGMRQLRATGWMHPRARRVAASFLCFDLGVDWRVGCDAWDDLLVESDAALATGNWQWVAGVGADLAQFPRIYNPRKQARAFDPQGTYVRRWIPELADAPFDVTREATVRRRQLRLDLTSGEAYPAPVVDHERAARVPRALRGLRARRSATIGLKNG